jgi:SCP-2 sterol transfer family protein
VSESDGATPASFYGERIPAQFNRALDRQQSLGDAGRRVYDAMRAVDATIRVDVAGPGGGTYFLNIRAGRMSADSVAAHAPFLTLIQDRRAFDRLSREAGDSALALLGGLAGIAGEFALTRARVDNLRQVDGLIRFEVTGEDGFALGTHFGPAPVPAEPKTRISMDADAYRDLRSGALDPQLAFMNQQIRVEGDMQAAMQLALAAVAPD